MLRELSQDYNLFNVMSGVKQLIMNDLLPPTSRVLGIWYKVFGSIMNLQETNPSKWAYKNDYWLFGWVKIS